MSHNNFKLFSGEIKSDKDLVTLRRTVEEFVKEQKITAKSIGIEYLESVHKVIITLGYSKTEGAAEVKLNLVSLGKISPTTTDFSALEKEIAKAASGQSGIICHELFIDEHHEFHMIFMVKA